MTTDNSPLLSPKAGRIEKLGSGRWTQYQIKA